MAIPARITDFLKQNGVSFEVMRHPAAFTAQELAAVEHVKGRNHAKVVVVQMDQGRIIAVLPADHRVNLDKLSRATGKPCALADESDFDRMFPDCDRGTMPPFGALYDLPTWVDRSLTADEYIVFEAGTHTDAIKIRYSDFERVAKPRVAEFAEKLH
ncbi:MAG TPA: YbaK/EbsC family protein [Candidatus Eisenbacteria bacterium]|jgi:Ala-tRNA(Pro) deacylase